MTKWGFKSRSFSRAAVIALLSSMFVAIPISSASATDYPPCTIQGTLADETLTGTDGNDVICTGGGNDTVIAGAGDDIVIAENGGSVNVDLGTGNDIFDGTNGSDAVVDGGSGDDELTGSPAGDELSGAEGDDTLVGGEASDTLNGGLGADDLSGSAGADNISGGDGVDVVDGGAGSDVINGGADDDSLVGGTEGDTIHGGDGNDNLIGDAGPDTLYGEAGADSIDAGPGDDILVGGDGVDVLEGGFGLNMCDYTATEPRTESCTYDDDGPAYSGFSFDQSSYEVGTANADVKFEFDVADPSGITWIYVVCWGNNTNTYPFSLSMSQYPDGSWGAWGDSTVSVSTTGDNKALHVSGTYALKFGTKPGTYDCYSMGRDTLNHTANWQFQSHLEVTRSSGTYDDDGPAYSGFSFDQSSYEVGTANADVKFEFDVADPSGITWIYVVCWGNNTNTYPFSLSMSQYPDGSWGAWGDSTVSVSTTGDNKALHVSGTYALKFGTKPGTYDCYSMGRDTLNHTANWQFQSHLNVYRTPAGMPGAPTSLSLTQDRPGRGVLSWAAPANLGNPSLKDYVIQVSEDGQVWTDLADGYSTSTSLPLDNLKKDADYWFRVRGENGGAFGQNTDYMTLNWGQTQVHTLAARVADAPTDLRATNVSSDGFKLAWSAPGFDGGSSITNFTVEVSSDAGKTWRSAKSTESTSLSYAVSGTSPGTTYRVRVAAINGIGSSTFATTSVTTLATVPGAPQKLTIGRVSYRTLTLGWSLPSSNGGDPISNYKIEFSGDSGATWTEIAHPASASRSFNVTSLTRGKTYKFRVSAINSKGVGSASESATATTLLALATAPQSLSVSGLSSTEATLNWSAPADNGGSSIASYVIEVSRDQGASWSRVIGVASTQTSARVGGMTAGTSYLYRVSAFTKPGKGESAQISLATPAVVASKPTSLKVSAIGTTDLTLSWTLPASNGGSAITDYKVEMSSNDGATWTVVSHPASKNLALKITGLPEGTKRLFRVSAINGVGTSDSSAVISGTTLGNVPDAPSDLKVTARTSTTVTITWSQTQVVGGSPVRSFVIEFSRDGGSTWAIAKSAVTKNLSSVISGFKSGTNYKIRVRAINDVGSSAASSFVSVTTR